MNIEYLQEFLMLSKTHSYSKACDLLYMNQSTLSKHIKTLEADLNVALFDRNTRNVTLTSYGEQLLPYAEKICDLNYKYQHELSQKKNNALSIGAIPSMAQYGIVDIILKFKEKYPDFKIMIDEMDSKDLKKNILTGTNELAFMRIFNTPFYMDDGSTDNIVYIPYFHDYLVALIPKTHPLYGEKELTLHQLEDSRLCLLQKNTLQYDVCINAFQAANIIPNIFYVSHRVNNIIEMSKNGNCIALLLTPPYSEHADIQRIVETNFSVAKVNPEITSTLSLCYKKDIALSYPAKKFIEYFKKEIDKINTNKSR
ncbi:MAG: LysR family transcriptional regulator [Butyrivibrio sp.]|nr:LysR family transcriptional regulator [Butyrivibrio sp.]